MQEAREDVSMELAEGESQEGPAVPVLTVVAPLPAVVVPPAAMGKKGGKGGKNKGEGPRKETRGERKDREARELMEKKAKDKEEAEKKRVEGLRKEEDALSRPEVRGRSRSRSPRRGAADENEARTTLRALSQVELDRERDAKDRECEREREPKVVPPPPPAQDPSSDRWAPRSPPSSTALKVDSRPSSNLSTEPSRRKEDTRWAATKPDERRVEVRGNGRPGDRRGDRKSVV